MAALLGGATPGRAQTPPVPPPPAQAPSAPPYEPQLLRLSELMGALHYLRGLCGFADAPAWRDEMNALMAAQALDEAAKERFAGAFNRGFRTFSETYRTCNEAAGGIIRSYLDQSGAITKELESRYGH
ncbi:TIGR02301 family protein [Labrys monachus]|uniref:Uncharacterized protein (TIGR02301 family) n=1 Tax=Labrys monachus TaxID=217067 RepID=A0ABU0FAQ6_9HYPH|nr:TIGR02301 family protein [Labrys monachus]MDQ0391702.1 uncharacterized protein (TIGR02301 family) [Labrys monachus]